MARQYTCGICGSPMAEPIDVLWELTNVRGAGAVVSQIIDGHRVINSSVLKGRLLVCPACHHPFVDISSGDRAGVYPPVLPGKTFQHLRSNVQDCYDEARHCMSCKAYTAAALMLRKLIMNSATEAGAKEGLKFVQYLEWLEKQGHITATMRLHYDSVRDTGNDATHKVAAVSQQQAATAFEFAQQLVEIMFESPARFKLSQNP